MNESDTEWYQSKPKHHRPKPHTITSSEIAFVVTKMNLFREHPQTIMVGAIFLVLVAVVSLDYYHQHPMTQLGGEGLQSA